jgi:hypothetical protein
LRYFFCAHVNHSPSAETIVFSDIALVAMKDSAEMD